MKLLPVTLGMMVLLLSCRENTGEVGSSKKRMKDLFREARVETQTSTCFDYTNGQKDSVGYCSGVIRFDTFGNVLEMKTWNKDGELKMVRARGYDKNGNEKWLQDSLPGNMAASYREEYTLDASGKTAKAERYTLPEHRHLLSTTYSYAADGTCERVDTDTLGRELQKRKYRYDESGNVVQFEVFNPGKTEAAYREITNYDEKGGMVNSSQYWDGNTMPENYTTNSCNQQSLPVLSVHYNHNKTATWEMQIAYTYRK